MTKDEIKNRINMALKDPVLQQGIEIICKENAKAKEVIENLIDSWMAIDGEQIRELSVVKEAERLLNGENIKNDFIDLDADCGFEHWFRDEQDATEAVIDGGWTEVDGKLYCPDCYQYNADTDEYEMRK